MKKNNSIDSVLLFFYQFFYKKKQNRKKLINGFTLIELLVVIAIIGLLASIVMVSLNTARGKARDARRISDVRQIQLALQMYYDANGSYPATLASLAPTYINSVPKDPSNGTTNYQYCVSATRGYHLGTGVVLEAANTALNSDADAIATICAAGGFSGADNIYDVTP